MTVSPHAFGGLVFKDIMIAALVLVCAFVEYCENGEQFYIYVKIGI